MSNKNDSLFEDVPYQESPANDDSLFDDTPHPEVQAAVDSTPERQEYITAGEDAQERVGQIASGGIGGAVGYGTGKLMQAGANVIDDHIMPGLGDLKKPEMEFITANPETYKNADSMQNLMDQWKNLAQDVSTTTKGASAHYDNNLRKITQDVNQASYDLPEQAKASLVNEAPMPKTNYYQGIAEGLKQSQGALSPVTPEARKEFFEKNFEVPFNMEKERFNLTEANKRLEYLKSNAEAMETFKGTEVYNKFQNDVKIAQSEVDNQLNKIKQNVSQSAIEKYRKELGVPEEISKLDPAFENMRLEPEYRKMASAAVAKASDPLANLTATKVGDNGGLVQLLRESANYDNKGGVGPIDRMATNIAEGVVGQAKELYPNYKAGQEAGSRAIKSKEALGKAGVKIGEEGIENLSKSSSDKIYKTLANPELYPDEFKQLQGAIDSTREFTQSQPLDFVQQRLAQADKLEKNMEQLGVKVDPNSNVELRNNATNKLTALAANPQLDDAKKLTSTIDEARTISSNPNMKPGQEFLNELNAAKIKEGVNVSGAISDPTMYKIAQAGTKAGVGGFLGNQVGGSTGMALGAAGGLAADVYGTKLQEMYALKKAGKLGKAASAINSAMPGILGGAGALIGATAAANAGEITPEEAGVVAGVEAFNPIPATDTVQAYIDAKKEYKRSGDPASALADGIKGFVSPIPVLANMANDAAPDIARAVLDAPDKIVPAAFKTVDKFGTAQSNDARARMEQNMKAKSNPVLESGKSLKQATPEQLMELSQSFKEIKGADNFVAPLENAANASSEEEKKARLFGLYQQPAFRQLINKGNKS